jgi:hypothetical protein
MLFRPVCQWPKQKEKVHESKRVKKKAILSPVSPETEGVNKEKGHAKPA